jgi:hypothetical protein
MLNDMEFSWRVWRMMERYDWSFLPRAGGILDQPQWLMDDLLTISWRLKVTKGQMPTMPVTQADGSNANVQVVAKPGGG